MINNQKLKSRVKELCGDMSFIHHKWYFKYHLEIMERLVREILVLHPEANRDIVDSLVWFHDLEKILRNRNIKPKDILIEAGFSNEEIEMIDNLNEIEGRHREIDLTKVEIEVQILSSADAAAHLIGPFYSIYWYENPEKPIEDLLNGDLEKIKRDWERKMVLPEVKKIFESRRNAMLEQRGFYPEKFI